MKLIARLAAFCLTLPATAAAGELWVTIDLATHYESPSSISSIVVGNPAIADVSVRSHREIILFGKTPGNTNISLFDGRGNEIETLFVRVQNPRTGMVTLQAGPDRLTFSCTVVCEQTNTIGDGSNASRAELASVTSQSQSKASAAAGASSGDPASLSPAQMPITSRGAFPGTPGI